MSSDMSNNNNESNDSERPPVLGAYPSFRSTDNDTDVYLSTTNTTMTGGEEPSTPPSFVREEQALSTTGAVILEDDDDGNKDEVPPNNTCRRWLCYLALLGALIMAVCIGIVIWYMVHGAKDGDKRVAETNSGVPTVVPTLSPSFVPTSSTAGTMDPATRYPTWNPTTLSPSTGPLLTTTVPTVLPTVRPSFDNMTAVVEQLSTLLGLQVPLDDPDSPYYQAVDWMTNVDQILPIVETEATSLDFRYSRRLAQRFVMSLLYYSTGGPSSWKDNCSFLDPQLHECEWKCIEAVYNNNKIFPFPTADVQLLADKGIVPTQLGVYCYDFPGFEDEIEHLILGK